MGSATLTDRERKILDYQILTLLIEKDPSYIIQNSAFEELSPKFRPSILNGLIAVDFPLAQERFTSFTDSEQ